MDSPVRQPLVNQSANGSAHPPGLDSPLAKVIDLAASLGSEYAGDAQRLSGLRERLSEGKFHLAVLGQFKRGKSTLLNALLGDAVLPTSVVPLTAIPTFIRSGVARKLIVRFENDRTPETFQFNSAHETESCLAGFVAEDENPKNRLGVEQVEVEYPAPILDKGLVLIDTPGIGSTFRHNTEATLNFLPQCDAALFLVSADPPITEVEVSFLKEVRSKVHRLFFILNKADYLSESERAATLGFLKKVLIEQAGIENEPTVFCVSARNALAARQSNDEKLWAQSGLAEVERHLVDFLAREKAGALHEAIGRKAVDIIAGIQMRLDLEIKSLQMPLDELEERLRVFEQKLAEIEHHRLAAADLSTGDWKRTVQYLEDQAEHLRVKARVYFEGVVEESLAGQRTRRRSRP